MRGVEIYNPKIGARFSVNVFDNARMSFNVNLPFVNPPASGLGLDKEGKIYLFVPFWLSNELFDPHGWDRIIVAETGFEPASDGLWGRCAYLAPLREEKLGNHPGPVALCFPYLGGVPPG